MGATSAVNFTNGTTTSLRQRGSPLPISKPFGLRFNHENTLKNFCGLEATSLVSCKSEPFFSGKESSVALWASFVPKAQKAKQNFKYHLQPQVAYRMAVLGAAGEIGQPLPLLIKMSPLVSDLHLFDIANVEGVAADLSHCNTPTQVKAFRGAFELENYLKGMNVIVIPTGVPREPGMTHDQQ